jgi:hypothetical protein
MKTDFKIDLSKLEDKEIASLKKMVVKSQSYNDAIILRDFQKHCDIVNKLINGNQD